jgi:acetylornithine deacetylase/succinyl-diaminopimelate desuccinylase
LPAIWLTNCRKNIKNQEEFIIENHKVEENITKMDVVSIASSLVRIPSYSLLEKSESAVAAYIQELLSAQGITTQLQEVEPGRFNVTGTLKGTGGGRSLMLCGHTDTVPAYGMADPFSGRVENGKLYGRGSCDMKGPLAAMLAAFIGIKRSSIALPGDLILAGVIDEEQMGKGIEYLSQHGPFLDAAVIGEPTDMRLALGHKGLEWLKLTVFGKKVHGGSMEKGINAIAMASRFIERIYAEYTPLLNQRQHPMLGHPTINIGKIEGGDQPSTVPGICTLEIDRRWIPEESIEQVYEELSSILAELHQQDSRFNAELKSYFPSGDLLPHKPFCTEESDPLVQSAFRAMRQLSIENMSATVFPAWSDAGVLAAYTQAKCIVIGPGDLTLAHTSGEYIETQALEQAAQFYGELALDYCGKQGRAGA